MPRKTTIVTRTNVIADSTSRRSTYRPMARSGGEARGAEAQQPVAELLHADDLVRRAREVLRPVQVGQRQVLVQLGDDLAVQVATLGLVGGRARLVDEVVHQGRAATDQAKRRDL